MPGINIHEHANVQNGIAVSSSANLLVACGTAQTVFCHVTATSSLAGVWEGTYAARGTAEASADWFDLSALKIDDAAVIENLPGATITPDADDVMAVTTMGSTTVRFRRTTGSGTVSFSVSNSSLAEILAASTGGSAVTITNSSLIGPGDPTIDSYATAKIDAGADTSTLIVADPGDNKQIWVYALFGFSDVGAGTIVIEDGAGLDLTGAMSVSDEGGFVLPPSGNFNMPWIKCTTSESLNILTVTSEFDGAIGYAVVSV